MFEPFAPCTMYVALPQSAGRFQAMHIFISTDLFDGRKIEY
jgi:hypothetical protein